MPRRERSKEALDDSRTGVPLSQKIEDFRSETGQRTT